MNVKNVWCWLHAVKFNVLIMNKNANLRSPLTSALALTVGVWEIESNAFRMIKYSHFLTGANEFLRTTCAFSLKPELKQTSDSPPQNQGASKNSPEFERRTTAWLNSWPWVYWGERGFRWGPVLSKCKFTH